MDIPNLTTTMSAQAISANTQKYIKITVIAFIIYFIIITVVIIHNRTSKNAEKISMTSTIIAICLFYLLPLGGMHLGIEAARDDEQKQIRATAIANGEGKYQLGDVVWVNDANVPVMIIGYNPEKRYSGGRTSYTRTFDYLGASYVSGYTDDDYLFYFNEDYVIGLYNADSESIEEAIDETTAESTMAELITNNTIVN